MPIIQTHPHTRSHAIDIRNCGTSLALFAIASVRTAASSVARFLRDSSRKASTYLSQQPRPSIYYSYVQERIRHLYTLFTSFRASLIFSTLVTFHHRLLSYLSSYSLPSSSIIGYSYHSMLLPIFSSLKAQYYLIQQRIRLFLSSFAAAPSSSSSTHSSSPTTASSSTNPCSSTNASSSTVTPLNNLTQNTLTTLSIILVNIARSLTSRATDSLRSIIANTSSYLRHSFTSVTQSRHASLASDCVTALLGLEIKAIIDRCRQSLDLGYQCLSRRANHLFRVPFVKLSVDRCRRCLWLVVSLLSACAVAFLNSSFARTLRDWLLQISLKLWLLCSWDVLGDVSFHSIYP